MNSEASRLREFLCSHTFIRRSLWESISDSCVATIKRAEVTARQMRKKAKKKTDAIKNRRTKGEETTFC